MALADGVESANVVGYTTPAAREGLNWFAPQFTTISANTASIQDIQLDDDDMGNVGWGDQMQIVGPLGSASAIYEYWDPSMYMGSGTVDTYFWSADAGSTVA
ncbi:MAG: hypothetical protein IJQ73_05505, partial [Kiritimatiellae bacterium]|nr:hypothetical protein [Kiritimatiellia bacterium]